MDYVAVAATVVRGALAMADALLISITERATELATIRAFGLPEPALRRLVITEGALPASRSPIGAVLGLAAAALFAGQLAAAAVCRRGRCGPGRRPGDLRGRAPPRAPAPPPARRPAPRPGVSHDRP